MNFWLFMNGFKLGLLVFRLKSSITTFLTYSQERKCSRTIKLSWRHWLYCNVGVSILTNSHVFSCHVVILFGISKVTRILNAIADLKNIIKSLLLLLMSDLADFLAISNKNLEKLTLVQSQVSKKCKGFKDKLTNLLHRKFLFQYYKISVKT